MRNIFVFSSISAFALLGFVACESSAPSPPEATEQSSAAISFDSPAGKGWPQRVVAARQSGRTTNVGQPPGRNLVNIVYDPLVPAEQAATGGDLLAHYQAPLIAGDRVFMMFKDAAAGYDPNNFASQSWGEEAF